MGVPWLWLPSAPQHGGDTHLLRVGEDTAPGCLPAPASLHRDEGKNASVVKPVLGMWEVGPQHSLSHK